MTADQRIIEGCIAGKRKAQSQLYEKYSPDMLGVCLRYCRNLEDAEDVLQESFIKVFRSLHTFRGDSTIGAWIKRIMINTAITHNKKIDRHGADNINMLESGCPDIPDNDEDSAKYMLIEPEILLKYVQELPQGYRTVLNLFVFEGYSHKEISGMLEISESTSKTQLFKARNYLKNRLLPIMKGKITA
jgi:RNA polymerase sigma-70 factor (ECF subfamily)